MRDELLVGYADIAAALGRDVRLVMTWADPFGWDPLPVDVYGDRVEIRRSRLETWRCRNLTDGAGEERVFRMPAIARRAQMSVRAAFDAAAADVAPLPVQREDDGTIWAYASAIDDYRRARTHSLLLRRLLGSKLVTAQKVRGKERFRRRRRWPVTLKAADVRSGAEPQRPSGDRARPRGDQMQHGGQQRVKGAA